MKRIILAAMIVCLPLLTACKEEKEVRTVQWYKEHQTELLAQVQICKDNPGQLKDDPNCKNAIQAMIESSGGNPETDMPRIK